MNIQVKPPRAKGGVPVRAIVSPGRISAWFVEDHTLPLVALRFAFRGGAAQDTGERPGVANLAARLLDEGAGPYNAQAFHEKLDEAAVELSFQCWQDFAGGAMRTLTRHLGDASELLRLALTQPRFDTDAVERSRGSLIARLRQESTDPDTIASHDFWERAYPGHPYGRPTRGTLDSAAAIGRDELATRHQATFARDNLLIVAVGDLDEKRLGALLDDIFGGLPAKAAIAPVPAVAMISPGEIRVVPFEIPQSVVRFGREGIMRKDADFLPAYVLNHVLGGSVMQSRLFTEVREKRGLAYSVGATIHTQPRASTFFGWTSTRNERVAESLAVIHEQVRDLAENGPTAEELEKAKKYLIGSYPLRFDSSTKIAGELMGLLIEDLGVDYVTRRNALIDAVTLADTKRVAKRMFGDGKLFVTIVGQPQGV